MRGVTVALRSELVDCDDVRFTVSDVVVRERVVADVVSIFVARDVPVAFCDWGIVPDF